MEDSDAQLALVSMNQLLDQWQSESLLLYAEQRITWTIVASQASYTVGSGAQINTPRPVYVDGVGYVNSSATPPLELPLIRYTDQAWISNNLKTLTSNLPTNFYYDLTYPTATLYLFPIPTATTLTGTLYCRTQVPQITDLDMDVALPNGWLRMIVTNLAVELAPAFTRTPSPTLVQQALQSKSAVKRSNIRPVELQTAPGGLIRTGVSNYWTWGDFLSGGTR